MRRALALLATGGALLAAVPDAWAVEVVRVIRYTQHGRYVAMGGAVLVARLLSGRRLSAWGEAVLTVLLVAAEYLGAKVASGGEVTIPLLKQVLFNASLAAIVGRRLRRR